MRRELAVALAREAAQHSAGPNEAHPPVKVPDRFPLASHINNGYTLADFLADVRDFEQLMGWVGQGSTMPGSAVKLHRRRNSATPPTPPIHQLHPSYTWLEAYTNQRYGRSPISEETVLRVRGDVCKVKGIGARTADELQFTEAVQILRDAGSSSTPWPEPVPSSPRPEIESASAAPLWSPALKTGDWTAILACSKTTVLTRMKNFQAAGRAKPGTAPHTWQVYRDSLSEAQWRSAQDRDRERRESAERGHNRRKRRDAQGKRTGRSQA